MIDEKKLLKALQGFHEREEEYKSVFDEQGIYYESQTGLIDEIIKYVQKMPKVGEWIPCSERLPEEKEPVLVQWEKYDRHLNITATYLDAMWLDDAEEKVFETINGVPNGKVVAWQPLPEPWEGE